MRVAIIGDLHMGKGDNKHALSQFEFCEKLLFKAVIDQKLDAVVIGGDLVDRRTESNNKLLIQIYEKIIKWFINNKVHLYVVCGNHDFYYRKSPEYSILTLFENEYIHIIKDKLVLPELNMTMFSYMYNVSDETEAETDIAIYHHDFVDFRMNSLNSKVCESGHSRKVLDLYKLNISGHYHYAEPPYITSPLQHNFEAFGMTPYFIICDTEKLTLDKIVNDLSPRYVKLYYNNGDVRIDGTDKDLDYVISNDRVRLIVESCDNKVLLNEFKERINSVHSYVDVSVVNKVENIEIKDIDSTLYLQDSTNEYVGSIQVPENVSREELVEEFNDRINVANDKLERKII